jgi:hypothetical protein
MGEEREFKIIISPEMKVGEEGGKGRGRVEGEEEGGGGGVGEADGHILMSVPGLCDAPPLIPRTE